MSDFGDMWDAYWWIIILPWLIGLAIIIALAVGFGYWLHS